MISICSDDGFPFTLRCLITFAYIFQLVDNMFPFDSEATLPLPFDSEATPTGGRILIYQDPPPSGSVLILPSADAEGK